MFTLEYFFKGTGSMVPFFAIFFIGIFSLSFYLEPNTIWLFIILQIIASFYCVKILRKRLKNEKIE